MKKKIYNFLASCIALTLLYCFFEAYMSRTADIEHGITYDGFGRQLYDPPMLARFLFQTSHSWAGIGWHLLDAAVFFGGFGAIMWLISAADNSD